MRSTNYILLISTVAFAGCRKPYAPPVVSAPASYLVVEGVINTGPDSTIISLSHTVNISNKTTLNPLAHATVIVESDQNNSYPLPEAAPGKYVSPGLNLDNTRQYRLRIKTPDNLQYLSDFTPVKVTPPIDSIGFNITGSGLQIYANANDPNNNTHYYRWDYTETWQFHDEYDSQYVSDGKALNPRTPAQQIYTCFAGDISSTIVLASTINLTQDMVFQNPITTIPSGSEKLEIKYSILLKQYALTTDAYNFWANIKKNTEQLGSIFDAQPSNIAGNIHNVNNPSEQVVGYISACLVQSKRIFISNGQLPQWHSVYPYACELDTNYFVQPGSGYNQVLANLIKLPTSNIAVVDFTLPGAANISGYLGTPNFCADCTLRGTTKTPPFWQ